MTENLEHINQWFGNLGKRIIQIRWGIIIVLILSVIVAMRGVRKIRFDVSNESWFLENDPLTIATNAFEEIFGNNDYVALLVEAEDVFAPDILRLIRELSEELEEKIPFADEVTSLTQFEFTRGTEEGVEIIDIVPEDIPTDSEAIETIRELAFSKDFLVNRLFSDDSKQAWIFLSLKPYPEDWEITLKELPEILVGEKVFEILEQEKYTPYTIKPTGIVATYEDREFFSYEANKTMIIAFCVAILVLFFFLRTLQGIVVPMLTAVSSVLWVFGAMGYLGIKVDTTIMTIPIYLGMAVSIGYSIHLFNFFRRYFFPTGKRQAAVVHAVEETGWPIFFTAATTISALLSFWFVPIRQVRWMGLSAASVVLTTYLIVMTLTPALLSFGKDREPQPDYKRKTDEWIEQMFGRLSLWIRKRTTPIIIISMCLVIVFLGGLTQIYVGMSYEKTLGLKVPYIKRLHYIGHTKIGSMDSYEITLTFDEPNRAKNPEILKNLDTLISQLKRFRLVKRVSSLLDVIKDMNQVMQSDDPNYYRIPDDKALVAQLLLLYEMANGIEQENWIDYEYTTLRAMVEISEFDTAEIERQFKYLRTRAKTLFPDAEFNMVGGAVRYSVAQNYIAKGEVVSFCIALSVIGILMMFVFRSVKTGLIGMIPNLAPVIVVGGLMGYLDIPLEMTTMMIIPMLLGLAVDDTIHFINHSKLEFQRTGDYQESIERTFKTVGKSLFMTSFILMATFSVYMTSVARYFVNLAILASSGVLSALLADYFITPILVAWSKPFGNPEPEINAQKQAMPTRYKVIN